MVETVFLQYLVGEQLRVEKKNSGSSISMREHLRNYNERPLKGEGVERPGEAGSSGGV